MRFLPKYFLAVIFLFLHREGNSQRLKIAKDFNVCLYGLIDNSGKWIVPAKYNQIQFLNSGQAIVMKDNLYGLINENGKEIVPVMYEYLNSIINSTHYYTVQNDNTLYQPSNSTDFTFYFLVRKNNTYGIIDTANSVIIPFECNEISNFVNGVAQFVSAEKKQRGFLDFHGIRGILSPELISNWSQETLPGLGIYIVKKFEPADKTKKKYKVYYGAYNDSAKLILPMEFDSINKYSGYNGIIEAYRNGKTEYYYKNGIKLFNDPYIIPFANQSKVSPLAHFLNTPAFDGKKWGVISIQGNKIIDFNYDNIKPYSYNTFDKSGPQWMAELNGKWGIINSEGKFILNAAYEMISDYWKINDSLPEYIFTVKQNGRWGAISTNGQEMMAFAYDTVFNINPGFLFLSQQSSDLLCTKRNAPIVALYNFDPEAERKKEIKEWKEKNKNDSTVEIPYWLESDEYLFNNYYGEDYYPEGEGYRWEDHSEKTHYGLINQNYYYDPKHLTHYEFGKYLSFQNEVAMSHAERISTGDENLFLISKIHNSITWWGQSTNEIHYLDDSYYSDNFLYAFYKSNGKLIQCNVSGLNVFSQSLHDTSEKFFQVEIPINEENNPMTYIPEIFSSTGKIILKAGAAKFAQLISTDAKTNYLLITDRSGDEGLMDMNGKFLLDTVWEKIAFVSDESAWVKARDEDGQCMGAWNKYSFSKKKLLFSKKEQFINPLYSTSESGAVSTKTGTGIYNPATNNFDLPPVYRALYNLNYPNDKYAAVTCHNHLGIFYSNGKMISDTTWNSIVQIYSSSKTWSASSPPAHNKFILLNDKTWALYDTQTEITQGDSTTILKALSIATTASTFGENMVIPSSPWLDAKNISGFKSWQQKLLFDSLFRSPTVIDYRRDDDKNRFDCPCQVDYSNQQNFFPWEKQLIKYQRIHHTVHFQNDSILVLEKGTSTDYSSQYDWLPIYYEWNFSYYNIFLFSNGPHVMTLDSLFIGEEWKKVLENATMNFLTAHPGISADCANPSMYPKIFNEMFTIDETGITFYPHWNYGEGRKKERVTFTIPWNDLKPYLRNDVASKIFD